MSSTRTIVAGHIQHCVGYHLDSPRRRNDCTKFWSKICIGQSWTVPLWKLCITLLHILTYTMQWYESTYFGQERANNSCMYDTIHKKTKALTHGNHKKGPVSMETATKTYALWTVSLLSVYYWNLNIKMLTLYRKNKPLFLLPVGDLKYFTGQSFSVILLYGKTNKPFRHFIYSCKFCTC